MNRIDRISAILVQLQSRPIIRAADVADRFGVSLRTVYRDMSTLMETGVPICGSAGEGYSLAEGYKLPPLMFTKEEALAFVTAGKFVEQLTDEQSSRHFRSGLDKVRAVLRRVDKSDLADVGDRIEVYRNRLLPNPKLPNLLQTILGSINNRCALEMCYYTPSRDAKSNRTIEAVGVSFVYPHWYLTAYCHFRHEYRNFRLDRVEAITPTDSPFSRVHPPFSELFFSDDPSSLTKVVLRTTRATSLEMGDRKFYFGLVSESEQDGVVEQVYMSYCVENIARWALSYIDTTTVIEPEAVQEKIRQILSTCR